MLLIFWFVDVVVFDDVVSICWGGVVGLFGGWVGEDVLGNEVVIFERV